MGGRFERGDKGAGFLLVAPAEEGVAGGVAEGGVEAVVSRVGGVVAGVDGEPGGCVFVEGGGLAGVFDAVFSEGEGGEVFNGVEDVGEVVERGDLDAVLYAYHAGVGVWHPGWPGGLEEDLWRWDDAWQTPDPRGCHGLRVFGH